MILSRTHSVRRYPKMGSSPLFIERRKHPPNNSRSGSKRCSDPCVGRSLQARSTAQSIIPKLSVNTRVGTVNRPVDRDPSPNSLLISESWVGQQHSRSPTWFSSSNFGRLSGQPISTLVYVGQSLGRSNLYQMSLKTLSSQFFILSLHSPSQWKFFKCSTNKQLIHVRQEYMLPKRLKERKIEEMPKPSWLKKIQNINKFRTIVKHTRGMSKLKYLQNEPWRACELNYTLVFLRINSELMSAPAFH